MKSKRSAGMSPRRKTQAHHRKQHQKPQPSGRLFLFPQLQRRLKLKVKKRTVASMGALAIGALGVTLAELVGVGEIIIGAVAAYATYRVIRYGVGPTEALIEGVELERGELPKSSETAA